MWLQKLGGGGICGLAYTPDGRTLFTRDYGGWVTAWDVAARAGKRLFQLELGERYAQNGLFVADGRFLVAHTRGGARVWDIAAAGPRPDVPAGLCYGPLLPTSAGSTVRFITADRRAVDSYDLATGAVARLFTAPPRFQELALADVSPDGRAAVLIDVGRQAVVLDDDGSRAAIDQFPYGRVRFGPAGDRLIWTSYGGAHIRPLAAGAAPVEANCFMPDWTFAISPTAPVFVATNSLRQLTLFGLDTGQPIRSLDFALGKYVMCATFSPDGLTCAVGGSNKQFAVFDVDV